MRDPDGNEFCVIDHRDAQADGELELFRQLQTCPKCGSTRYTEMRIKGASADPTSPSMHY